MRTGQSRTGTDIDVQHEETEKERGKKSKKQPGYEEVNGLREEKRFIVKHPFLGLIHLCLGLCCVIVSFCQCK